MQPTNNRQSKTEKAFTLIELLVVIAIVGILAGLAVVSMSGATEGAKIAKSKVFSNSVNNSLLGNRVSEWRFDETAGTNSTDTVGTNNGNLNNFTFDLTDGWRSGSSCVSGGCLQFDGSNDYVDCGDSPSIKPTDAMTLSVWVKGQSTSGNAGGVGAVGSSGFRGYAMSFYGNNVYTCIAVNSTTTIGDTVGGHDPNVWVSYVMVYSPSTYLRLYRNGLIVSNITAGVPASQYQGNGISFKIGQRGDNTGYFNGLIDEVRIYNGALTSSAIRDQYLAGLDELLASGQITDQDYQQRLADLNSTYAIKE